MEHSPCASFEQRFGLLDDVEHGAFTINDDKTSLGFDFGALGTRATSLFDVCLAGQDAQTQPCPYRRRSRETRRCRARLHLMLSSLLLLLSLLRRSDWAVTLTVTAAVAADAGTA